MERSKIKKYDGISSLICSEWYLSLLLPYLLINEIAKLDSSICNHEDRKRFLICLSTLLHEVDCIDGKEISYIDDMVDWIVTRKLNLFEVSVTAQTLFDYDGNDSNDTFLKVSDTSISKLTENNPHMKKISLHGTYKSYDEQFCTNKFFYSSFKCCKLEYIVIGKCIGLPQLLQTNNNLKTVHLYFDTSYTVLFSTLGTYCPALEELYVKYGEQDEEVALYLNDNEIEIFSKGCRNLKSLKLENILNQQINILVKCFSKYNSKLEVLDFSVYKWDAEDQSSFLSLFCFKDLTKGCPYLKNISLYACKISVQILSILIDIENININRCEILNDGFVEIGNLPKLKSLDLFEVYYSPGQSIAKLFFPQRNNVVEDICIRHCKEVTDDDLLHIAANCPNLKKLRIGHLNITDQGIANLFSFQHKTLEDINIMNCKNLTDQGFLHIGMNCPYLKKIQIFDMIAITDQGIKNLFQGQVGNTLEHIDITSCAYISDHSLLCIAANCPHLKKIYIYEINSGTDESLWELFHKCEKLIDMICKIDTTPSHLCLSQGVYSYPKNIIPIELQLALNKRKAIMTSHYLNS